MHPTVTHMHCVYWIDETNLGEWRLALVGYSRQSLWSHEPLLDSKTRLRCPGIMIVRKTIPGKIRRHVAMCFFHVERNTLDAHLIGNRRFPYQGKERLEEWSMRAVEQHCLNNGPDNMNIRSEIG